MIAYYDQQPRLAFTIQFNVDVKTLNCLDDPVDYHFTHNGTKIMDKKFFNMSSSTKNKIATFSLIIKKMTIDRSGNYAFRFKTPKCGCIKVGFYTAKAILIGKGKISIASLNCDMSLLHIYHAAI